MIERPVPPAAWGERYEEWLWSGMGSWHHHLALLVLFLCQITGSVHPSETPGALYLPSKLPGASYSPPKLSGISHQPQKPPPLSPGTPEVLTSRQLKKVDMEQAKDTPSGKSLRVTSAPHAPTHTPARLWWSALRPSSVKRVKGKGNSLPRNSVIPVDEGPTVNVTCVGRGNNGGGCPRDYIANQKDNAFYDGWNYNDTVSGGCVDGDNCSISAAGGYGNGAECVTGNSICGNRPAPAAAAIPGDNGASQTRPMSSLQQLWLKEGQIVNSRGQMKEVKHRSQSTGNDPRLKVHVMTSNLGGRLQGDARVYKEEDIRYEAEFEVESLRSFTNRTHHQPAGHGNRNERDVDANQDHPQVTKSAMARTPATRLALHPADRGTRSERDVDTDHEGDTRGKAAMKRPPLSSTRLTLLHPGLQERQRSQAGVVGAAAAAAAASVSSSSREGHTIFSTAPSHVAILPSLPPQFHPLFSSTSPTRGPCNTPMESVGKATTTNTYSNPPDEENEDNDYDDNERDEDGDDEDDDDDDDEDRDWGSGSGGQQKRRNPESGTERYNKEKKSAYQEVNTVHQQRGGASSSSPTSSSSSSSSNRLLRSRSVGKTVVNDQHPHPLHHHHHHQHHHYHHNRKLSRQKRKKDVYDVRVLLGDLGVLPCDLALSDPRDSVQLILWIKEGVHTPIYSYDYRDPMVGSGPRETKPQHHTPNSSLASRISFRAHAPAALLLQKVVPEDAGVYRCRVDHLHAPTTNTRTSLTVVVPPTKVRITWRLGEGPPVVANSSSVGPFKEGDSPTLTCTSLDGWPPPAVLWFEGSQVIDGSYSNDPSSTSPPPPPPPPAAPLSSHHHQHHQQHQHHHQSTRGGGGVDGGISSLLLSPTTNDPGNPPALPRDLSNVALVTTISNKSPGGHMDVVAAAAATVLDKSFRSPLPLRANNNKNNNKNHNLDPASPPVTSTASARSPPPSSRVSNGLTMEGLTRSDLGRRLTCRAISGNDSRPVIASVTVDMTLAVVAVEVEAVEQVWAGDEREVECRVYGCRPGPLVVWWLESTMLPTSHYKESKLGDNVTIAVLKLTPRREDDGAMLICQATNELLPELAYQDSCLLSVSYAPVVEVLLGASLDPGRIKEGDDVYFECSITAKPPATAITWRHDGVELETGPGVFVSNMSLVVQGVTRARGGDYTCHATNPRATSSSPPIHLDVKYAPVCGRQERTHHSVGKRENAEVSCRVDANPPVVTFRWTFNNTAEAINVPEGRFVVVGTESRVNYTPMNDLDYGTLLCWANNSVGTQTQPCVFHILPAGKPDPPHNCRVLDVTMTSMRLTCLPGDGGDLGQKFLLQIFPLGSRQPMVEETREEPTFSVSGLRPATTYLVGVAGVNHRGASRATQLQVVTNSVLTQPQETSAEPTREREGVSSVLSVGVMVGAGGAVGALLFIIISAVLILLTLRRRCRPPCPPPPPHHHHHHTPPKSLSALSKEEDTSATLLPATCSPHHDPDLLSHTPDPGGGSGGSTLLTSVSTTSTLHTGQSSPYTTVSEVEYTQLACPPTPTPTPTTTKAEQEPSKAQETKATCPQAHHHTLTHLTQTYDSPPPPPPPPPPTQTIAPAYTVPYLTDTEQPQVAVADCGRSELYRTPLHTLGSSTTCSNKPSLHPHPSSLCPADPSRLPCPSFHTPDPSLNPLHHPAYPTIHPSSLHTPAPSLLHELPCYSTSSQCQCRGGVDLASSRQGSLSRRAKLAKERKDSVVWEKQQQESPGTHSAAKMESSV